MKIYAADWILPVSAAPIERGAVAFENDRIAAVGTQPQIRAEFSDVPVEDFGEAAILPGFVNCHAHLELTMMRGFLDSVEHDFFRWLGKLTWARAALDAEDLQISSVCGALEGARAGVTCFGDIATDARLSLAALRETGLRGTAFQEIIGLDPKVAAERAAGLREQIIACRELETAIQRVGVSPHAPYSVSPRLFELVTDLAIAENLPVSIHAAESEVEENFVRTGSGFFENFYRDRNIVWRAPGVSPVQYLRSLGALETAPLLAHCVRVDERDLEIIAQTNSKIAHCPKSNAKFAHGAAPLDEFAARNLAVGLGSDSVASNNVCDLLEEARFAALLQRAAGKAVSAETVLRLATLGGARALGLAEQIGSLEAGKQADFAVVSFAALRSQPVFDPVAAVVFASSAADVVLTAVAGCAVYEKGAVATTDETVWRERLKTVAQKLRLNSGN